MYNFGADKLLARQQGFRLLGYYRIDIQFIQLGDNKVRIKYGQVYGDDEAQED